jgi:TRAP-type C4-dicarboxylate transport system substrate-binding protein
MLTLVAALCVFTATTAMADKVTLRVAYFAAPNAPVVRGGIRPWLDAVVADSQGTLDYKLYEGGTLGRNPAEQYKLVRDGVADIAFVVPDYTAGVMPGWGVTSIPNLVLNAKEASLALERAMREGLIETPDGVKVLGVFSTDVYSIHSSKPLEGLAGLKGLRVRGVAKAQLEALVRLGAVPVPNVRGPAVAEGISRGTMDAALFDYSGYKAFRIDEVGPNHMEIPMGAVGLILPINSATWNKLSDAAKQAFNTHSGAAFAEKFGTVMYDANLALREAALGAEGNVLVALDQADQDAYAAALDGVEAAWVEGDATRQAQFDGFTRILSEIRASMN